ncbi:MAG: hypothetical protein SWH68_04580 [Thermodesulfobacteriota bacterium]|nr:hypothetical protein [Thermodesulfobacteriota bacterium]
MEITIPFCPVCKTLSEHFKRHDARKRQLLVKEVVFPDGRIGKPSLSTLKRKLKKYRSGGFAALGHKPRSDRGQPRAIMPEVSDRAITLKKEQPSRSHVTINRFLREGPLARSTRNAWATFSVDVKKK